MEHDEDFLEQLYWEFDQARKCGAGERLAFKAKLRAYAIHVDQIKQERRSAVVELTKRELIDKWIEEDK